METNLLNSTPFLRETLARCGIFFAGESSYHEITCLDPSQSYKLLQTWMRIHNSRIPEFFSQLKIFMESRENIIISLENMITESLENNLQRNFFGQSNSLIKLLLRLECFQGDLIEVLIQKMLVYATPADNNTVENSISVKIFNHIRWCDYIFDHRKLLELLMEAIEVESTKLWISNFNYDSF